MAEILECITDEHAGERKKAEPCEGVHPQKSTKNPAGIGVSFRFVATLGDANARLSRRQLQIAAFAVLVIRLHQNTVP